MTPAWVEAVKPEAQTVEWRDALREGLSLRVTPKGRRTWYVRYSFAGRERRYRLGVFPAVKLAAAESQHARRWDEPATAWIHRANGSVSAWAIPSPRRLPLGSPIRS